MLKADLFLLSAFLITIHYDKQMFFCTDLLLNNIFHILHCSMRTRPHVLPRHFLANRYATLADAG